VEWLAGYTEHKSKLMTLFWWIQGSGMFAAALVFLVMIAHDMWWHGRLFDPDKYCPPLVLGTVVLCVVVWPLLGYWLYVELRESCRLRAAAREASPASGLADRESLP